MNSAALVRSPARTDFIKSLCIGQLSHVLNAAPKEIAEEAAILKAGDIDSSTLDEGENVEIISPLMAERVEELGEHYGDEELSLTKAERAEIGRPLIKFKPAQVVEDDEVAEFRKAYEAGQVDLNELLLTITIPAELAESSVPMDLEMAS